MKRAHADRQPRPVAFRLRSAVLLGLLLLAACGLLARALELQLINYDFCSLSKSTVLTYANVGRAAIARHMNIPASAEIEITSR